MTWPLSAAATAQLGSPRTSSQTVLRLSMRELVLSGTWLLERTAPPRRWEGRADGLRLLPGDAPVPDPPPLATLDRALRGGCPYGGPARAVMALAVKQHPGLADALRAEGFAELTGRGLLVTERRLLRTHRKLTPTGHAWAASPAQERARWRTELAAGRPVLSAVVAAPGVVLTGGQDLLLLLDAEVRRLRGRGELTVEFSSLDLEDGLSGLGGLQDMGGLDSAVDSGSGGGGDGGGDGGGGGGD